MEALSPTSCNCGSSSTQTNDAQKPLEMLPIYQEPGEDPDAPCCGPPAGPPSSIHEKPGYNLCHFVKDFINTPAGPVPRIKTTLEAKDHSGTLAARIGVGRNDYKVSPGLYATGDPQPSDPVLVTSNYKLSFDHLRKHLGDMPFWILVLDTRGINVWCAAGKGTFGTQEIIRRVQASGLSNVVDHKKLILPQLGAPGVSARQVKQGCGFRVIWGPVRTADLPAFVKADMKATTSMRRVTFSLTDRLVLVPVELWLIRKALLWSLLAIFVLSGVGSHLFSFSTAWQRGLLGAAACIAGVLTGAALVPALLPWIPGRSFALKGILAGTVMGLVVATAAWNNAHIFFWTALALILLAASVSSYLAMNFTGTTPFTSPSGVEKEMRRFIPIQLAALVVAAGLWVGSAF
jgi:hypothetical protein